MAGVESHRYSPFSGPGTHFFEQSYEKNQVQKIRHTNHYTILKIAKSIFVPGNPFCPDIKYRNLVIVLYAWAPHTNSGFIIVKSAMRLINCGQVRHFAVLVTAYLPMALLKVIN